MSVEQLNPPKPPAPKTSRRLPVGAEVLRDGGVQFRVWAPRCKSIDVVFEGDDAPEPITLEAEADGYFVGTSPDARAGMLYRLRPAGHENGYPDPASRYQPQGVHGPSQVVDPDTFKWTDKAFPGVPAHGQVLYEMHFGTFTPGGTYLSAIEQLQSLRDVGVTCLEIMPVCEFAGSFGWGYDGVNLFAPYSRYGTPDDLRRFVDHAHSIGLGVILDVVYNHLGPDGNYITQFSDHYFNHEHHTDWGDAINFDGDHNAPVRELYVANAQYWIDEFHFDGFRFDATQAIVDDSPRHVLADINAAARAAASHKTLYLINENEPQDTRLVRPEDEDGYGLDALWNDDFHHAAMTVISGHREAYYHDHPGTPQEFISSAKYGYLFQGQRYEWQRKRRGTPALDLSPTHFVHFLQNHDQVANSGRGLRGHRLSSPAQWRAMSALLLLMPQTPMLFQGQEYNASQPFFYFAEHNPELAKLVRAGRAREMSQFPSVAVPEMQACLRDPEVRGTFQNCVLDHDERDHPAHKAMYDMTRELLRLRREEKVFRRVQKRGDIDGAVLGDGAFLLRFFGPGNDDRLLIVNFERDLHLCPCPEPLLAPPLGKRWGKLFGSEDPQWDGAGTPAVDTENEGWLIPGRTAVLLSPRPAEESITARVANRGSAQAPKKKPKTEGVLE